VAVQHLTASRAAAGRLTTLLLDLASARTAGLLTDEEYREKRSDILARF
jgi:hypothetical protein